MNAVPVFEVDDVRVFHGDCIEVMRGLPDESVHAVVTDPPYGISFMGKAWDAPGAMLGQISDGDRSRGPLPSGSGTNSRGFADHDGRLFQRWCEEWATEALRVLKPGGHMLAFGASRGWHRLAVGIENAGFEIRDSIAWLYGSGFPKSLDVSKAIDNAAGAVREVVGTAKGGAALNIGGKNTRPWHERQAERGGQYDIAAPATDEATEWQGWGTALKPAFEPIVVARKPLGGTVAANVLVHGTGAINIDATRVAFASADDEQESKAKNQHAKFGTESGGNQVYGDYSMVERKDYDAEGRHTPNVVLDGAQADELDRQTSGAASRAGASRFFPVFRYEAKASSHERPKSGEVAHPTVKPLELMRWLVRLVMPPGGVLLEPFAGSGTTLEAAVLEGFACIGIEREAEYLPLIEQRLSKPLLPSLFGEWDGAA